MIKYVEENQPKKVMMVTECSMSDNVQIENPNVKFVKPCNLCPHMKKITLPKILDCLENETETECSANPFCKWQETICVDYDESLSEQNIILDKSYELELGLLNQTVTTKDQQIDLHMKNAKKWFHKSMLKK